MNFSSMTTLLGLLPPENSVCKVQNCELEAGVGLLHRDLLENRGKAMFRVQTRSVCETYFLIMCKVVLELAHSGHSESLRYYHL